MDLVGKIYRVDSGPRQNTFIVFIEYNNTNKTFGTLLLPDLAPASINTKDVLFGVENKIISEIEKLPNEVFNICKEEYTLKSKIK